MKAGWIFAAAAMLVAGLAIASLFYAGAPDPPTRRSGPAALALHALPADLPPLTVIETQPDAPYGPLYDRALALFQQHRSSLRSAEPPRAVVRELAALLQQAAAAAGESPGFLDKHIALRPGGEPSFGDALEGIADTALAEADRRWDAGDPRAAAQLLAALWVLGERSFRDNVRLYPRMAGLAMISRAGMSFHARQPDAPLPPESLLAWGAAIDAIDTAWTDKLSLLRGVKPPIGDLLRIAREDADPTFRVEALLQLGLHQHAPVGRANRRAIRSVLQESRRSDHPLIAAAAQAAAAFTAEEMRRVR